MASCNKEPVTLVQIDVRNNRGNPERIDNVDEKTCKLSSTKLTPFPIVMPDGSINKNLHGGVWISESDFIRLYESWKKDCEINNNN